jgi:hypothetical protein
MQGLADGCAYFSSTNEFDPDPFYVCSLIVFLNEKISKSFLYERKMRGKSQLTYALKKT